MLEKVKAVNVFKYWNSFNNVLFLQYNIKNITYEHYLLPCVCLEGAGAKASLISPNPATLYSIMIG